MQNSLVWCYTSTFALHDGLRLHALIGAEATAWTGAAHAWVAAHAPDEQLSAAQRSLTVWTDHGTGADGSTPPAWSTVIPCNL